MNNLRWILAVLILISVVSLYVVRSKGVQMGQAFEDMICSDDETTKLTAIILSAELENNHIQDLISQRLPKAKGVERIAIMYSLYAHNGNLEREFVDSIPVDEEGIIDFLNVESPLGSYFSAPYLRIINAIGDISMHNDEAFEKLKRIYTYSDGWQGDLILEMVMSAERRRGKDTDLLLDSLQQ